MAFRFKGQGIDILTNGRSLLAAGCVGMLACQTALAGPHYHFYPTTDAGKLGAFQPVALTDAEQVVGTLIPKKGGGSLALTTQNNVGLDFCGSNGAGDQTSATAISPDGASRYLAGDCGVNHTAYLYDWDMNLTTPVVYPAAKSTYVTGVNAGGLTVGSYATTGGVTHGFYLIGSLYVTFDPPGATTTNTWGISTNNAIYGNYSAGGSVSYGFLLSEGGTYTTLNPANSIATVVAGLNAANEAAGFYLDSALREHAFWWVNGGFGTISLGSNSVAAGINQAGQMAGTYWDTSGVSHGFVVDTLGSTYITFNAPTGATGLVVTGVNNTHAGVSGYYQKGGKTVGFLALCEGKGCY